MSHSNKIVLGDKKEQVEDTDDNIFTTATCHTSRFVEAITPKDDYTYYFVNLKHISGAVIEWEGTKEDAFGVYFWNKSTCPVHCYHLTDEGTEGQSDKRIHTAVAEAVVQDYINDPLKIIVNKTNNSKIKQQDYKKSIENGLNKPLLVRSKVSTPKNDMDAIVKHSLGIEKACMDEDKTKLRPISELGSLFLKEDGDPKMTSFPTFVNDDVEKMLTDLVAEIEEYEGDVNKSLTGGSIMNNLMAMTLLVRDVQTRPWNWCSNFQANLLSCTIDILTVKEIEFQNSRVDDGEFFFPRTDKEIEIFVEDMERVRKMWTGEPNANIVLVRHIKPAKDRDSSKSTVLRVKVKHSECPEEDKDDMDTD